MTEQEFSSLLKELLKTFDRKRVTETCEQFISFLNQPATTYDEAAIKEIMSMLRNHLLFDLVQQIGDALILTNKGSFAIRKLYAQSLIDQNHLPAAKSVLMQLISDTQLAFHSDSSAKKEEMEARGLLGRTFKQLYINKDDAINPNFQDDLQQSIEVYYDVYLTNKAEYTWHGINVVALLIRAKRDKIDTTRYPNPVDLANAILNVIEKKHKEGEAYAWDFATAAEACIALNDETSALEWMSGYARMPEVNAFQLNGTLRQLVEVWQLDLESKMGGLLLPILRAELLKRSGGTVVINADDVLQRQKNSQSYLQLVRESASENTLEKVFGNGSFETFEWYKTGIDRCMAVARIGRETKRGLGTGFLLKGKGLCDQLGEELILLTNAHVVSQHPEEGALHPDEAVIIFEILDYQEKFTIKEIIWSSPSNALDAAVLRFDEESLKRLQELTKNIAIYPVSPQVPVVTDVAADNRIYIIGHPGGGTLQLSLYDNVLLDYENPRLHYRTPTIGGSSGSPVFNRYWQLIGLHHAGSNTMPMLNGKTGTYEANEGIWIQAIKKGLANHLESKANIVEAIL